MSKKTERTELLEEIIFCEILPRLPAKSLLRFKSVSKHWNSFISGTLFIKTHLHHPNFLSSRSVLSIDRDCSFLETIDYQSSNLSSNKFDKYSGGYMDWLISSCNGLALFISSNGDCAYQHLDLPDCLNYFDFEYVVYNPILGVDSFVEIEHPDDIFLGTSNCESNKYSFGFGYVLSHDDYYIVAIDLPLSPDRPELVVYVYSLRFQKWETPRKFRQNKLPLKFVEPWYNHAGTLLKERLHWGVILGKDQKYIVAFNLANQDEFKFMELPYAAFGDGTDNYSAFKLCNMDDCLCAWGRYEGGDVVEMWMLKQYGVQESWTKLFRLNAGCYCQGVFGLNKSGMVLIHADELMIVDFNCDPPEYLHAGINEKDNVVDYVQSLVSPLAIITNCL